MADEFKLKYTEPFWSGLPPPDCNWAFEVVRGGVELPPLVLAGKACFLIGRVPLCDIVLDNETVSRQHAVIQCRSNGKIYAYDLGSTYGTFVNRERIAPSTFVELAPGMQLRFGSSTRVFILTGGPPPPTSDLASAPAALPVAQEAAKPKARSKRNKGPENFTGTEEDAEKLIRSEEHKKRMRERAKARKQSESRGRGGGGGGGGGGRNGAEEQEADDADMGSLHARLGFAAPKPKDANDSGDDSGAESANEGEADPDHVEVGAVKRNWDELDVDGDREDDEYYDRGAGAARAKQQPAAKALTRADIAERRAELDLERRALQAKIDALGAADGAGADVVGGEDDLDAYMHTVARDAKREQQRQLESRLLALRQEDGRLAVLFDMASSALDRMGKASGATSEKTLEQRAAERRSAMLAASAVGANAASPPRVTAAQAPRDAVAEPQPQQQPAKRSKTGGAAPTTSMATTLAALSRQQQQQQQQQPPLAARALPIHSDPELAHADEWVPPVNQRGDGMTDLNKRFGY